MNKATQDDSQAPARALTMAELRQVGGGNELQDCLVTSFQVGGHSAGTVIPVKVKHNV